MHRIKVIRLLGWTMNCAHLWEWNGDSRGLGGPVWTIKWPEQLIRPWWWLNKTSGSAYRGKLAHTRTRINHLWISCHDCVVPIIIAGRGLNMQSAGSVPVSYLLVMDILFEDLLAIFEPVNLLGIYADYYVAFGWRFIWIPLWMPHLWNRDSNYFTWESDRDALQGSEVLQFLIKDRRYTFPSRDIIMLHFFIWFLHRCSL